MVAKARCTRLLLICITAIGCNGSDQSGGAGAGAASCGDFKACGGNLVGDWNVTGMCFDDVDTLITTREEPECQKLIRKADVHVSGTYQFTTDGHASADLTFSIDMDVLWTTACLRAVAQAKDAIDLPGTCTNLEANYAANPTFAGASCEVRGTDCSCMVTSVDTPSVHMGTYTTKGSALTDDEGPSDYCVAGNTLKIHATGTDGGGTLTLKR